MYLLNFNLNWRLFTYRASNESLLMICIHIFEQQKKTKRLFNKFSYAFTFTPKVTGIHSIKFFFLVHQRIIVCILTLYTEWEKKNLFKRNEKWLRNYKRNSVLLCIFIFGSFHSFFFRGDFYFIFLKKELRFY